MLSREELIEKIKELCKIYDFPYRELSFTKFNGERINKIKIEKIRNNFDFVKINIIVKEKSLLMRIETEGSISNGFHTTYALLNRLWRILSLKSED